MSCDACHLRKTKCDLDAVRRSSQHRSGGPTEQDGLVRHETTDRCSFCLSLGIPCRITVQMPRGPGGCNQVRHKKGRRIRALLADAAEVEGRIGEEQMTEDADHPAAFADRASHPWQSTQTLASTIPLSLLDGSSTQRGSTPRRVARNSSQNQSSTGLPSSHQSSNIAGAKDDTPGLLGVPGLNAAALRTCIHGFLDTLSIWMPLTVEHTVFLRRFEIFLQNAQGLHNTDQRAGQEDEPQPLSELLVLAVAARGADQTPFTHLAGRLKDRFSALIKQPDYLFLQHLDGIEAVTLLGEAGIHTLHPISAGGRHPDCMTLDPFGKGFAAELCLFANLNREPPAFSPDYERRSKLFWTIYCHDALRSASAGRMYRLHEEDVGWPIQMQASKYPTIYLATLARKLCRTMLSARTRSAGIVEEDIESMLTDLDSWPDMVGMSVNQLVTEAQSGRQEHHVRVKQAMLLTLSLRLSLSVWTAVQEVGYLPSSRAMIRVEDHTARAAASMVQLATVLVKYALMDYGPTTLVGACSAWALYLIHKIGQVYPSADDGTIDAEEKAERVRMVETLIMSIKSAKTRPEAKSLLKMLKLLLRRAKPVRLNDIANIAESDTVRLSIEEHKAPPVLRRRPCGLDANGVCAQNSKRRAVFDAATAQSIREPLEQGVPSEKTLTAVEVDERDSEGHRDPTDLLGRSHFVDNNNLYGQVNTMDIWPNIMTDASLSNFIGQDASLDLSPDSVSADDSLSGLDYISFMTAFNIDMPVSLFK